VHTEIRTENCFSKRTFRECKRDFRDLNMATEKNEI
jgi:hypothetical protein